MIRQLHVVAVDRLLFDISHIGFSPPKLFSYLILSLVTLTLTGIYAGIGTVVP